MSASCLDIIHGPSRACLSPELLEALTAAVSPATVISRHERDLQRFAQGYKEGTSWIDPRSHKYWHRSKHAEILLKNKFSNFFWLTSFCFSKIKLKNHIFKEEGKQNYVSMVYLVPEFFYCSKKIYVNSDNALPLCLPTDKIILSIFHGHSFIILSYTVQVESLGSDMAQCLHWNMKLFHGPFLFSVSVWVRAVRPRYVYIWWKVSI